MRALVIVHQPDAGPGVFSDPIESSGFELDYWTPSEQPDPPGAAGDYDAILSFGGSAHPRQDQRYPWLKTERALLKEALRSATPTLAVCLGAQLLAEAAGARARVAHVPEIGWYEVKLTRAAETDPLLKELPRELITAVRADSATTLRSFEALEWHTYEIPLPHGATALAGSDTCLQAYRIGRCAWGLQSHPEVTVEDFRRWIEEGQDDPSWKELGLDADELLAETDEKIDAWQQLGRVIAERFLQFAAAAAR